MEGSLDMELISKETIKPSQPSPPHLKVHPVSFLDQITFHAYVPIVYFYHPDQVCDQTSKVLMLKKSLSQILSKYYPFAGRLVEDRLSIECNDQGALLLVTRVKSKLSQILQNPIQALLSPLFPEEQQWKEIGTRVSPLAIQINNFACGGMAIGVCLTHKVGDAATLFNFVNDWATTAREPGDDERMLPSPALDAAASMFPQQRDFPSTLKFEVRDNIVCKRFVFEGSKIESLKAMVSSQNVQNPTRVQVVLALIYKCAVSALGLRFGNTSFVTTVNIRRRMVPPLPGNSVGNMVGLYVLMHPFMENRERELHEMVRIIKQGLSEFCAENFEGKDKHMPFISDFIRKVRMFQAFSGYTGNESFFSFSSWSGFPIYEADFGWGKPIWAATSGCPCKNVVFFKDTRDGKGIEAFVNMEKKDMAKFELHEELLQYASLNPTITC